MATYFLDFDRTLFDTSTFLAYLIKREGRKDIYDSSDTEAATLFNDAAAAGLLSFSSGELLPFMYPDAESFLNAHAKESVIVTYGNVALQKAKLENIFASRPDVRVIYTGDERKGPFIAKLVREYPGPHFFFDDKPVELESVGSECPDVSLFEMRRDGAAGSGRFPVLRSFGELT